MIGTVPFLELVETIGHVKNHIDLIPFWNYTVYNQSDFLTWPILLTNFKKWTILIIIIIIYGRETEKD